MTAAKIPKGPISAAELASLKEQMRRDDPEYRARSLKLRSTPGVNACRLCDRQHSPSLRTFSTPVWTSAR